MNGPNRIDPTPVRLSTTATVERQTPKSDFGDRLKGGIDTAASAVANGAAVAAPFVPGGAIVSAAVSSVSSLSNSGSAGAQGAVSSHYASQAMNTNTPVINTPASGGGSGAASPSGSATAGGLSYANSVSNTGAGMQNDLLAMQAENAKLMQVQMAMQRENQVFSTVSNVLKVRHDTVKNTIQNVR